MKASDDTRQYSPEALKAARAASPAPVRTRQRIPWTRNFGAAPAW